MRLSPWHRSQPVTRSSFSLVCKERDIVIIPNAQACCCREPAYNCRAQWRSIAGDSQDVFWQTFHHLNCGFSMGLTVRMSCVLRDMLQQYSGFAKYDLPVYPGSSGR